MLVVVPLRLHLLYIPLQGGAVVIGRWEQGEREGESSTVRPSLGDVRRLRVQFGNRKEYGDRIELERGNKSYEATHSESH